MVNENISTFKKMMLGEISYKNYKCIYCTIKSKLRVRKKMKIELGRKSKVSGIKLILTKEYFSHQKNNITNEGKPITMQ